MPMLPIEIIIETTPWNYEYDLMINKSTDRFTHSRKIKKDEADMIRWGNNPHKKQHIQKSIHMDRDHTY